MYLWKIIIFLFFNSTFLLAQINISEDSLRSIIFNSPDDSTKVNNLIKLSEQLRHTGVYDSAFFYGETALKLSRRMDYKKGMASSYNNFGLIYFNQGNYSEALKNYFLSLNIRKKAGDKKGIAASYNNIGLIYENQGNYPEGLKFYFAALKINEETGNKKWASYNHNNIGNIYKNQGNLSEALHYYQMSLKIKLELEDLRGASISYNNIGIIYFNQGNLAHNRGDTVQTNFDFSESLKNYAAALKIRERMGDKKGIADTYNNIGNVYAENKNYLEALKSYNIALKIEEKIGEKPGIAGSWLNLGIVKLNLNDTKNAKKYLENALSLALETGYKEQITECYSYLSELHSATSNFKAAYSHFKLYTTYKDSLFSEEKSKEIGRLEMRHEFEMADMKQRQAEEEKRRQLAVAVSRRNTLQYSGMLIGIFGLFVLVFFIGKFNLPHWAVELAVFIPFLIFFEFILVLMDPYIEGLTGGEPLFKLLINALLAAVIFPVHGYLERVMKRRMARS